MNFSEDSYIDALYEHGYSGWIPPQRQYYEPPKYQTVTGTLLRETDKAILIDDKGWYPKKCIHDVKHLDNNCIEFRCEMWLYKKKVHEAIDKISNRCSYE